MFVFSLEGEEPVYLFPLEVEYQCENIEGMF